MNLINGRHREARELLNRLIAENENEEGSSSRNVPLATRMIRHAWLYCMLGAMNLLLQYQITFYDYPFWYQFFDAAIGSEDEDEDEEEEEGRRQEDASTPPRDIVTENNNTNVGEQVVQRQENVNNDNPYQRPPFWQGFWTVAVGYWMACGARRALSCDAGLFKRWLRKARSFSTMTEVMIERSAEKDLLTLNLKQDLARYMIISTPYRLSPDSQNNGPLYYTYDPESEIPIGLARMRYTPQSLEGVRQATDVSVILIISNPIFAGVCLRRLIGKAI